MIITRLKGGLGNQLFQYALGRRIALENQDQLWLDNSYFATYRMHTYSLAAFNIHAQILNHAQLDKFLERTRFFSQWKDRLRYRSPAQIIHERTFHYDPAVLSSQGDFLLDGFWQSPKYFNTINHQLRQDLVVAQPQLGLDQKLALQIRSSQSVSLHVRRGDYVSDPSASQHGVCNLDYYQRCIAYIQNVIPNSHFYLFSDDVNWVQAHFGFLKSKTIVRHNRAKHNYNDLRLMSQCTHHIIANSTFSWWGAWLGQHPHSIVIAPRNWYADTALDSIDLIPKKWKRL